MTMLCRIASRRLLPTTAIKCSEVVFREPLMSVKVSTNFARLFVVKPNVRFLSTSSCLHESDSVAGRSGSAPLSSDDLTTDEKGRVLVYRGPLKTQIKAVKVFSLSTSIMGLLAQPVLYNYASEKSLAASVALYGLVGFYTFVTPLLIHTLTKKYVTELLHDPKTDTYTAVTVNILCRRKELEFNLDEVTVPEIPGPFSSIIVKKIVNGKEKTTALFIPPESREFEAPLHYGRLMGFDKPLDLHLNTQDKVETKK